MIHPYLMNGKQSDQSIWEVAQASVGSAKGGTHPVGTKGTLDDGRTFMYARNSGAAAIVAGNLLSAEAEDAQNADLDVNTAAVGATLILVTPGSTAAAANDFEGGYLCIVDDTGEGVTYRVEGHAAVGASAEFTLNLTDPVNVALGANATATLIKNPWGDVIVAPAAQAHLSVGVSNVAVPAGDTIPQYFWCQTSGVTCGWQETTTASGAGLTSGATEGQIEIVAATDQQIGTQMVVGIENENQPIFLSIT
jgi:hypothetical protein